MSFEPKYHHLIPQTYMKPWCHNSNTIWAYDKSTQKSEERNISKICGKDYFHSINAGSFHTTEAALERIFSALPLESYVVSLNDVELKSPIEFNQKFTFIDEWKIKYRKTRTDLPKNKRNCIIREIKNAHDNHIEDEWNRLFENGWREFCCGLIYHIGLSLLHFGTVTQEQADTLFRYYVMFDWRSFSGNEQFKEVFDLFQDTIVSSIECDNPSDLEKIKTEMLEMKRNVLLSAFDRFFSHDGVMQKTLDIIKETLSFVFLLPVDSLLFATSDTPAFVCSNPDGEKEGFFVIAPKLAAAFRRKNKDKPDLYGIETLSKEKVDYYNTQIINAALELVLSKEPLDISEN